MKSEIRNTKFSSLDVLAAFVFGIISAVPLGMLAYFYLVGEIENSLRIVILAALGACIGALLCIVFFRVVLKKLTGTEEPSLVTVIEHSENAVSSLGAGQPTKTAGHIVSALKDTVAVFAWINGRRWITSVFLGAIGLFAGAATTYFLVQQNAILDAQNSLFKRQEDILSAQATITRNQMLTQESQRYLPLNAELNSILAAIQEEGQDREGRPDYMLKTLTEQTQRRIEALSLAYRPYWYIDSFSPTTRLLLDQENALPSMVYLSPERGLILRAILQNRVAMHELSTVDFSFADMRGIRVEGSKFGDWTASEDAWGDCALMQDYASMFAGSAQEVETFEKELKNRLLTDYEMRKASLPTFIPGGNNSGIDFSHSYLGEVYLDGHVESFRFLGTTLVNAKVAVDSSLDLSGAEVRSMSLEPSQGFSPIEITARDSTFYGQICVDGIPFDAEETVDPEVQRRVLSTSTSGFSGARISEWLVDKGFFAFADLDATKASKIDSEYRRMDWQLYAFPDAIRDTEPTIIDQ